MTRFLTCIFAFLVILNHSFAQEEQNEYITDSSNTKLSEADSAYISNLYKIWTDTIIPQQGTVKLPGCHASITVPDGYYFLNGKQSQKLLTDYWGNTDDETLLGCIISDTIEIFAQIETAFFINYDECGYIKDEDAADINKEDLLKNMKEEQEEANEERKELGLPTLSIAGWVVDPYYDNVNKTLNWGTKINAVSTSEEDEEVEEDQSVNLFINVLGKKGYICLQAVGSIDQTNEVINMKDAIISSVHFDEGYQYKDFDESKDRIAEYTVGGLVAGKVLAKVGFFAKFWKLILAGGAGILVFLKKLFGKKEENASVTSTDNEKSTEQK